MSILISNLSSEQKGVLDELTEVFCSEGSELDRSDVLRFCVARDFDKEKSQAMLQAHIGWRKATLPIEKTPSVQDSLSKRRFYYLCQDKTNDRPIVYVNLLRYVQDKSYDPQTELQASLYTIENEVAPRIKRDSVGSHAWSMLLDISGIKSPPLAFLQLMNSTYEANYPERLHRMVMFPVNSFVKKIIQGILVFVDPKTRAKFYFVNTVKELVELADVDNVQELGDDVKSLIVSKNLT